MKRKRWRTEAVTMQASLVTVMLCILLSPEDGLDAQDKQQEDSAIVLGVLMEVQH